MGAISKANGCCHTNCLLPQTIFPSAVNTTDQENCVKKWGFWGQFFVEFVKGKLQQFVFVLTQLLSFLEHIAVHSRSMPFRTRSWSSFFKAFWQEIPAAQVLFDSSCLMATLFVLSQMLTTASRLNLLAFLASMNTYSGDDGSDKTSCCSELTLRPTSLGRFREKSELDCNSFEKKQIWLTPRLQHNPFACILQDL